MQRRVAIILTLGRLIFVHGYTDLIDSEIWGDIDIFQLIKTIKKYNYCEANPKL